MNFTSASNSCIGALGARRACHDAMLREQAERATQVGHSVALHARPVSYGLHPSIIRSVKKVLTHHIGSHRNGHGMTH